MHSLKYILNFLNERYAAVNEAATFERTRPEVLYDKAGNRPKITYQFSTGQFTRGFGEWFQGYLAKIFGPEKVVCASDEANPDYPSERVFSFSIFGEIEELEQKANWWKTQGIEKSDKNEIQLRNLFFQHADSLFEGHKVKDVFISGHFNRLVVVDFEEPFVTNDVGYEVFKRAQEKIMLNRGFVMVRNKQEQISQFWIELDKVQAIDVLRAASRNEFRLES